MQDESFVTQAAVYQIVQQQLQAQTAELDKARKIMEGLQRECEGYKHSIQGLVQQVCGFQRSFQALRLICLHHHIQFHLFHWRT